MEIKSFLLLTVAGAINAFGVTFFLNPVKLYDSGISGTSMLLSQITPDWMNLSLFLLILNIPLFLYGLKKQGGVFTLHAIFTVAMYSLFAYLITGGLLRILHQRKTFLRKVVLHPLALTSSAS